MAIEFKAFPKIPRYNKGLTVSEKIDGTNAAVIIGEDGAVGAQSRSRIITPEQDNFGFAQWVRDNTKELSGLGVGHHYGEWWGRGIQRGYGREDRVFSLFHTHKIQHLPKCVSVVPKLGEGISHEHLESILDDLTENGSYAQKGFMQPEGIVVFHEGSRQVYKIMLEGDSRPKSLGNPYEFGELDADFARLDAAAAVPPPPIAAANAVGGAREWAQFEQQLIREQAEADAARNARQQARFLNPQDVAQAAGQAQQQWWIDLNGVRQPEPILAQQWVHPEPAPAVPNVRLDLENMWVLTAATAAEAFFPDFREGTEVIDPFGHVWRSRGRGMGYMRTR